MLRVPLVHAVAGMRLVLPVFHPRRAGTVLLETGFELDARSIGRLDELNVREVWIDYPGTSFIRKYVNPAVFAEHAKLTGQVAEALHTVARSSPTALDYTAYKATMASLLEELIATPQAALFLQEIVDGEDAMLQRASTVCFLSLLMGLRLEAYLIRQRSRLAPSHARDVTNLGVGAMLMDVGMLRLDPQTLERWRTTGDCTDPRWRRHVEVGYRLLRGVVGPSAAAVVLHHHQRFDGGGFPARQAADGRRHALAGEQIHVFARIAAAADTFARLRTPASRGGAPAPVVRVLSRMLEPDVQRSLDPMVFKALLAVTPPYAPGSIVRLSNGVRGVVASWDPSDPCRVEVRELTGRLADRADTALPRRVFDLRAHADVRVVEAEGYDVSADNFYPPEPNAFNLAIASRALFNAAIAPPSSGARREAG